jgi:multidrug efflux pump subunit AcrB
MVMMETPPGTTIEATQEIMQLNERWLLEQPEVGGLFAAIGVGGPGQPGRTNQGIMFTVLKSRHERERSAQELIVEARTALGAIPGQKVNVYDMGSSMVGGGTRGADFEFFLRGNLELVELDQLAGEFSRRLEQHAGIVDVNQTLKMGLPEVRVIPDREKAAALGVDATALASTWRPSRRPGGATTSACGSSARTA